MSPNKRIALWMSEKKLQKVNWQELETVCGNYGFEVFKLCLKSRLDSQGPFCVFVHKMTDIIASANLGDARCIGILQNIERYISRNPSLIVIDPIPNVRKIIDRYSCYSIIHSTNLCTYDVFTPNFCTLETKDVETIKHHLQIANVTYPFLCKPLLGHGSRRAHQICIIFNERSLINISTPCVAQSFINHDALLSKIYVAGDKHCMVERPSLKNFQASDRETIYFESSDVSKAGSKSLLSVLDPEDVVEKREPDEKIINLIATTLREAFGMDLFGVDVVIEKSTGKYAIIDVNAYPGYDGFPNFYEALLECISKKLSTDLT